VNKITDIAEQIKAGKILICRDDQGMTTIIKKRDESEQQKRLLPLERPFEVVTRLSFDDGRKGERIHTIDGWQLRVAVHDHVKWNHYRQAILVPPDHWQMIEAVREDRSRFVAFNDVRYAVIEHHDRMCAHMFSVADDSEFTIDYSWIGHGRDTTEIHNLISLAFALRDTDELSFGFHNWQAFGR
jgi:hypothetical protein